MAVMKESKTENNGTFAGLMIIMLGTTALSLFSGLHTSQKKIIFLYKQANNCQRKSVAEYEESFSIYMCTINGCTTVQSVGVQRLGLVRLSCWKGNQNKQKHSPVL